MVVACTVGSGGGVGALVTTVETEPSVVQLQLDSVVVQDNHAADGGGVSCVTTAATLSLPALQAIGNVATSGGAGSRSVARTASCSTVVAVVARGEEAFAHCLVSLLAV